MKITYRSTAIRTATSQFYLLSSSGFKMHLHHLLRWPGAMLFKVNTQSGASHILIFLLALLFRFVHFRFSEFFLSENLNRRKNYHRSQYHWTQLWKPETLNLILPYFFKKNCSHFLTMTSETSVGHPSMISQLIIGFLKKTCHKYIKRIMTCTHNVIARLYISQVVG